MKQKYPDYSIEKQFVNKGFIAGIDEAGRGPLAGPVVAAAVILQDKLLSKSGINDSKKLKEKEREKLFDLIRKKSLSYSFSFIDNEIIDKINILQATQVAMKKAVEKLIIKPDHLLVDGNYFNEFGITYTTIVKGDSKSISIASASIVAKVVRDKWMVDVADKLFPEYGFAKHKGYATKEHYRAIEKYGLCPLHRRSFLKKIVYKNGIPNLFRNSSGYNFVVIEKDKA
ncbi:MAG: ribonuclease HII [Bacteroidetes bacterium]|nr:MAG: ribonuclease HII [Bacteroidota bacterium]